MNKYEILKEQLGTHGTGKMTCFGNSMLPILKSGSTLTFIKQDEYRVGDIVFCKVKGRFIDAHKVINVKLTKGGTQFDHKQSYLIANNKGWENGWTTQIFGKAIRSEYQGETKELTKAL